MADSNANIFHLTAEKLRVLRFPFPDPSEQTSIVALVDSDLGTIRATESKLVLQIDKLREYRQALITAAVAGQLDIPVEAA